MSKPIHVVGGGLAGLALGIGLRQREVPVIVSEARDYPRHRVCGEFISGEGLNLLERWNLKPKLLEAGALWAKQAELFEPSGCQFRVDLSSPALCLSRYVLDHFLAQEFCRLGGTLRVHERCTDVISEGLVRATGRRAHARSRGWFWYGLKAHATDVVLDADLELHFVPGGYVGLCRLSEAVNVCGLFRSRGPVPDLKHQWQTTLRGPAGTVLHTRMQNAVFQPNTFCAVAGIRTGLAKPPPGECVLGDAWSMTPPFTGNGMSMALEAAELAIDPLKAYSSGAIDWSNARDQIARRCRQRFRARLLWSGWLDRVLFSQAFRRLVALFCTRFPALGQSLFECTR